VAVTAPAAPLTNTTDTVEVRATAALLRCIARFGWAKTTLDDVAREAGCSRATLYRYFDGKAELLARTLDGERTRVVGAVVAAGRAAATLPDAIVATVTTAARELQHHDALRFVLAHEPGAVLGHLAFGPGDRVLVWTGRAVAPAFTRWLEHGAAARAAEWLARVVRSYVFMPEPPIDLADERVARAFLGDLVVPGLAARASEGSAS
jgi:AcrR family transcriptional regulator